MGYNCAWILQKCVIEKIDNKRFVCDKESSTWIGVFTDSHNFVLFDGRV